MFHKLVVFAALTAVFTSFRLAAEESIIPSSDVNSADAVAADVAGLYDTLSKGLQARRQSEFDFLTKVVLYVQMNKISRKMVLETFHWARRKVGLRRDTTALARYPYPYFERAIKIRAAKIGVKL